MSFNDFLHSIYWDAFSGIINMISVLITATLTFIIINQTKRLSKSQNELELKLSKQQNMIQKRQIRVDVFPYKREIYLNLFKVLEFTHFLETTMFTLKLEEKAPKDIYTMYTMARDNYLGDSKLIMESLRESEYILPHNIVPTVLKIRSLFDNVCSTFIVMATLQEIIPSDILYKSKKEMIDGIKRDCIAINSKVNFIQSIMPIELNISRLDG